MCFPSEYSFENRILFSNFWYLNWHHKYQANIINCPSNKYFLFRMTRSGLLVLKDLQSLSSINSLLRLILWINWYYIFFISAWNQDISTCLFLILIEGPHLALKAKMYQHWVIDLDSLEMPISMFQLRLLLYRTLAC